MALINNFTQRYIDEIDPSNVAEDFIVYFSKLSDARKMEIIDSRPELDFLLTKHIDSEVVVNEETKIDEMDENIYDSIDLKACEGSYLEKIVLYTVESKQEKCKIHRIPFSDMIFRYNQHYGYNTKYCKECNRLYIEECNDYVIDDLKKRGAELKYYDLEKTNRYIRKNIKKIELTGEDTIFVPDVWIDDNPLCPVHEESLTPQGYILKYKDRSVEFSGFYCDICQKPIIRKTKKDELEEECGLKGIKFPHIEPLRKKIDVKKMASVKKQKPDYIVENGSITEFDYNSYEQILNLDVKDTLVVSDAAYCNHEGHETDEVICMLKVLTKRHGEKKYVFLGGYCSQCQKYYMDEQDYRSIYPVGRPSINILNTLDDKDFQITSGEVFEKEKRHLQSVEEDINNSIDDIKNKRKAIGYINAYKEDHVNDDKYGVEVQKQEIQKYADENGYEIIEWKQEELPRANDGCPVWNDILYGDCYNPPVQAVIVYKNDIVARDTKLYFYYVYTLEMRTIKLLSTVESFEEGIEFANITRSLMLFMAEQEKKNIALRTSKGRSMKAACGGYAGGRAPYGYKPVDGKLVINPDEIDIVKIIFEERSKGNSFNKIAVKLLDEGYRTRNGSMFASASIKSIVDNEMFYKGFYRYGKDSEWIKGVHQPLF